MASYQFWMEHANRWNKCVDFGSPMSAWSVGMLKAYDEIIAPVPVKQRTADLYIKAKQRAREL